MIIIIIISVIYIFILSIIIIIFIIIIIIIVIIIIIIIVIIIIIIIFINYYSSIIYVIINFIHCVALGVKHCAIYAKLWLKIEVLFYIISMANASVMIMQPKSVLAEQGYDMVYQLLQWGPKSPLMLLIFLYSGHG